MKRITLCISGGIVLLLSPMVHAEPVGVQVERMVITNPVESSNLKGAYTSLDLWITHSEIVGLGNGAEVVSASDDVGTNLLEGDSPFDHDPASSGYFMPHQMTVNTEEQWLRVPVFLPAIPHQDAKTVHMELSLELLMGSDGTKTVIVDDVDLSHIPGWGVDVGVEGKTLTCRDERRERPEDQPLELYCFVREGDLLGIKVPGQDDSMEPGHPDANLVVAGAREGVTLEVELPQTSKRHLPVQLEFGLGLHQGSVHEFPE